MVSRVSFVFFLPKRKIQRRSLRSYPQNLEAWDLLFFRKMNIYLKAKFGDVENI